MVINNEKSVFDNSKYSAQRERVYQALVATKVHPTAELLCAMLAEAHTKVSLPTIYRNLKELTKAGKVHTLETMDNKLHYDADISEHSHFICKDCGRIIDIYEPVLEPTSLKELVGSVEEKKCVYYGTCNDCKSKSKNA